MTNGCIWEENVQHIKNVGPRRVFQLRKLGINTVGDLLYHFPREYDDRSCSMPVSSYDSGEKAAVSGVVFRLEERSSRKGLTITRAYINDGVDNLVAVWYNQPFIKRNVGVGFRMLVTGKVVRFHGEIQIQVDDFEIEKDGNDLNCARKIAPVYPLTGGLSQRQLRTIVKTALEWRADKICEFIPDAMLTGYILPGIVPALWAVHFPNTLEEAGKARRRFIFEEFLIYQVMFALIRKKTKKETKRHVYPAGNDCEKEFLARLPFSMTPGQAQAWKEIDGDMQSNFPMNRLLQGDVGSGKTLVCALAMMKAAAGGFQSVFMVPTEILAGQHYANISAYFDQLGVSSCLLTGGMKKKERDLLREKITEGKIQVVIGTHALLQDDISFKSLALAVIDEQHRFGVRQRALLREKGQNPDVLVVTATPIPRTLSMTVYGDLDVSAIRGMPPGREPVKTYVLPTSRQDIVYREIKKEISLRRQVYIVCPLVEESEKSDLQAAVDYKEKLSCGPLAGAVIDILHGRMRPAEKEIVMSRFRNGEVDVLVSTTVIEVGVDVPNATVMVVVDAHRFGLAQLHQLRGRVGRGSCAGRCYLVSDAGSREAQCRLEAMRTISDGFVLAEKDLELRGPGEMHGTRQSGDFPYRVADPAKDLRALEVAAREARRLVDADPELRAPENLALAKEIKERFGWKGSFFMG